MRRLFLLVCALCAVVLLAGCSTFGASARDAEAAPPESKEPTIAVVGAPVSVENTADATLPEDIPLWPQATVTESVTTEDGTGVSLLTRDTYDDVFAGIAVGFERAGWAVAREEAGESGERVSVLTVGNGTMEGVITIAENPNRTTAIDYVFGAVAQ